MQRAVLMLAGRDPLEEIGGGHCSYVRAYARAARHAGYTPHILCVSAVPGMVETDYGVVHRVPDRGRPHRQTMIRAHAPALAKGALSLPVDWRAGAVLHGFGVWSYAALALREHFRGAGLHVPFVMSMYTRYEAEARAQLAALAGARHAFRRLRQWAEWRWIRRRVVACEQAAMDGCDVIAVNYRSVHALVTAHGSCEVRLIPFSPESAFLPRNKVEPIRLGGEGPLLVTIALQRPKKGVAPFLRALARLRAEGRPFRAAVVGGGPLLGHHRRLADALGLADAVRFPGLVPDVRPWLAAADLYVQPSIREESGSLALLEAMQFGRAVVACDVDGIAEDVRGGTDGLLVPPGDAAALAGALARLLDDPALRQHYAAAAAARFKALCDINRTAEALKTLYRTCAPCG